MSLIPVPGLRAIGSDGLAMAGARLQFYLTGTTTPASVYTSSALSTPHTNPVIADSGGLFAPIYLNPAVTYRCRLLTSGGSLIQDIDPFVVGPGAASQSEVDAGSGSGFVTATTLSGAAADVVEAILGYTPANKAGEVFTGAVRLNYSPSSLTEDAAGLRGAPLVLTNSDATFALSDAGCGRLHTASSPHAWTIPPNSSVAYPVGTAIVVVNTGSGAVTLTRGSGVVLRSAGSSTDANKSLAQHGVGTLFKVAADDWYVSGAGVS